MKKNYFPHIKGEDFTMNWLLANEDAMTVPLIIDEPEGLGMKMPDKNFTVSKVAAMVGPKEKVEVLGMSISVIIHCQALTDADMHIVLDVASQREDKGWTLQRWADYYNTEPEKRDKIRNVISLEISETKLAEKVLPPRLVREIDWVEQFWPANRRKGASQYPKVQLYCLMSVADCWTVRRFTTILNGLNVKLFSLMIGLACRLCGVIGLLSYPQRLQSKCSSHYLRFCSALSNLYNLDLLFHSSDACKSRRIRTLVGK